MTTRVTVSYGYTVNMGDFESLRIDLGAADDAKQGETAQQALDRVSAFVEKNLVSKVEETKAALKGES